MPDLPPVTVLAGEAAWELLSEEAFQRGWKVLHLRCPWATQFQSPAFVTTWYKVYRERFTPVLARAASPAGQLVGLLTLAIEAASSELVVAGTHHAEYQAWLAPPEFGDDFIEAALLQLRRQFPHQPLSFTYLPPSAPLLWAAPRRPLGRLVHLHPVLRPLMSVTNPAAVAAPLHKKSNESKLHRLCKAGPLCLEQLLDPAELESLFDQIALLCDLRQGALNDSLPFLQDPLKKPFHLALMRVPGLLHVTLLRVNGTVAAAHLGVHNGDQVSLGVLVHSPYYARHSPGKLLLRMLAGALNRQRFSLLDLTPELDGWKARFATHHDQVYTLTVFPTRLGRIRHALTARFRRLLKRVVLQLGLQPARLRDFHTRLLRLRPADLPAKLLARLRRRLWHTVEVRLYAYPAERISKPDLPAVVSRDRLQDLFLYQPHPTWHTRRSFLAEALRQLEGNARFYSRVEEGRLVHYGWLLERQEVSELSEVGLTVRLPPGTATLFGFYTEPCRRGRGLYQASLRELLWAAAQVPGTRHVWISVRADNGPSRHVIEKVGFTYQYSLFQRTRLGRVKRWSSAGDRASAVAY